MKNQNQKIILSSALFMLLMVIVIAYFSIGELTLPREDDYNGTNIQEITGWQQVFRDGSVKDVTLPQHLYGEKGRVELRGKIKLENTAGKWIMFWNQSRDVNVYINNKLRYSYNTEETKFVGEYSPFSYLFIPLEREDSGGTIRIVAQESYSTMFNEFYGGDRLSLYKKALGPYLPEIIFAFFLMGVGITCIIVLTIVEILIKESLPLTHLSWAIFVASMWILVNDGGRQFIFPNVSIVRDVAYMLVCVMPIPFLMYCDEVQGFRNHIHYVILELLGFIDAIMVISLYFFELMDWIESFKTVEAVIFIDVIFVAYTIIKDIKKKQIRDYFLSALTIFVLAVAITIQVILFIALPSLIYNGIIIEVGMFLALTIAVINTVISLNRMQAEKYRAIMETEEKAKFLASMSHEIRTPINAVLGMNELILREAQSDNILEYASNIESSGNHLLSLVNDILDFSKIEAGHMEILPVEYMTSSLINDAVSIISSRIKKKGLKFTVEVDPKLPITLKGDELRIRQVIINLLTNAVKYSEKGQVVLKLGQKYEIQKGFLLVVTVKDTGIGIKKEDQEKLFDSFARVDALKNRGVEGTGLGLTITKRIVDQMGGNIKLISTYGKGSEFTIEIPQIVVDRKPIGKFEITNNYQTRIINYRNLFTAPEARVLVVDDNNMNLAVFKGLLKKTKATIDIARSGREAIDKVITTSYDVIYLDHMMPEMDGVETLQKMRELGLVAGVPVIALTANAIDGAKEQYMELGFEDYLAKPVDGNDLEENLMKWLPQSKIIKNKKGIEDILDQKVGMSNCGEDEEFYKEMVGMYINGDKSEELIRYYEEKDWDNYRIVIHSLKSTSMTIGAVSLSEKAREQEMAVKNMDMESIEDNHKVILAEYAKLLEELRSVY